MTTMPPKPTTFTVVIPTYNREAFIDKAIRSVLKQTCTDWKLLIMDDASTDQTYEKVAPYLTDPRIQYFRMEENSGISKVMNQALAMVDTPFLVQLDSDDWLPREALSILKRYIRKDKKNTALFYGNVKIWRVKRERCCDPFIITHKQFHNKYDFLQYNRWMVAPRCYRVEALREVGGWDTSDPYEGRIMEDRRMILRLIERYPVKWINRMLYNRTKHRGQLTDKEMKSKRNRLRRETFQYYLTRWGGKYKPVYGYKGGYLIIKELKRVRRSHR
ncbi:glycosyltransferase involved in cell wall biosynthesis [Brevibacillus aydinogluensis]|jgi:glycosyltransferase involved in cell wall biosynthesis|uniref:Glycosyl transferase n=1 Tax=Brevibacillus aydinogluensis TaxID=927786 RepID=A0AA48RCE7_9BACL|nr:glycosyltransferase involved in cell wall biosynthesis [Brevibacillus aydinogluensis]CAJ1002788.1 Glycosyl transferase [Brevibacillus aydinogluensis]